MKKEMCNVEELSSFLSENMSLASLMQLMGDFGLEITGVEKAENAAA